VRPALFPGRASRETFRISRGRFLQSNRKLHLAGSKGIPRKTAPNGIRVPDSVHRPSDSDSRGDSDIPRYAEPERSMAEHEQKGSVWLYDNTMREGEQTVGVVFSKEDKVRIATQLVKAGVSNFEAGFAAVSAEERKAIRAVVEKGFNANVFSLARLKEKDVDEALEAGVRHIGMFVPSSDSMIRAKLSCSARELEHQIPKVVEYAKRRGLFVRFACEDGTRTPWERLLRFNMLAREAGADCISLVDTAGIGLPERMGELAGALREELNLPISAHCHNDLGLAVANSLAAARAGAKELHVTVNGLGDRAGNTAMDELVLAMKVGYGIDMGIDLVEMAHLSSLLSTITGLKIPFNKPIVGRNAFRHESGVHVQVLLKKDIDTYGAFPPEWVGRKHEVAFGKHAGRSNIRFLCNEVGLALDAEAEIRILERVKALSQKRREEIGREEVLQMILEAQNHIKPAAPLEGK